MRQSIWKFIHSTIFGDPFIIPPWCLFTMSFERWIVSWIGLHFFIIEHVGDWIWHQGDDCLWALWDILYYGFLGCTQTRMVWSSDCIQKKIKKKVTSLISSVYKLQRKGNSSRCWSHWIWLTLPKSVSLCGSSSSNKFILASLHKFLKSDVSILLSHLEGWSPWKLQDVLIVSIKTYYIIQDKKG